MFEKEAEEYRESKRHKSFRADVGTVQINYESYLNNLQSAFKDGAKFGYNKANEWHYVKDGDLPKDEKDRLLSDQLILLTKMKGTNNLSISIGQYNFSTQEFNYQHIVGLTDVIAWKEIVLPKEIG